MAHKHCTKSRFNFTSLSCKIYKVKELHTIPITATTVKKTPSTKYLNNDSIVSVVNVKLSANSGTINLLGMLILGNVLSFGKFLVR